MASRKSFGARPSYIYPASTAMISGGGGGDVVASSGAAAALFEFDESEVWSNAAPESLIAAPAGFESKKWIPAAARSSPARSRKNISSSVPVNVPDWSKILKEDFKDRRQIDGGDFEEDFDGGDEFGSGGFGGGDRIPPHEYLARTRGASLSVHEGVGRTLKGRDLRRVRNAIWKKVGFED